MESNPAPRSAPAHVSRPSPSVPRALLSAAVAGLLSAGTAACETDDAGDDSRSKDDCSEAKITSTEIVPDLSLEEFTEDCDALGGEVETHAICGGVNTCAGLSYDDETFELTEHTCCAVNTCSGFSCVLGDEA